MQHAWRPDDLTSRSLILNFDERRVQLLCLNSPESSRMVAIYSGRPDSESLISLGFEQLVSARPSLLIWCLKTRVFVVLPCLSSHCPVLPPNFTASSAIRLVRPAIGDHEPQRSDESRLPLRCSGLKGSKARRPPHCRTATRPFSLLSFVSPRPHSFHHRADNLALLRRLPDRLKVDVALRLLGRNTLLVIIPQKPVEEVDRFVRDEPLVLGRDEPRPWPPRIAAENVVKLRIEIDVVLLDILSRKTVRMPTSAIGEMYTAILKRREPPTA
jgi:hypothetical protein